MITTFLWMLYLAFTIYFTTTTIYNLSFNIFKQNIKATYTKTDLFYHVTTCLLWSIWYFYYLN